MIISIAMDDRFADEGPNIKPFETAMTSKFKDIFPPIDIPEPDSFVMSREWFRNELNKNLDRRRLISHGAIDIQLKPTTNEGATNGDQS